MDMMNEKWAATAADNVVPAEIARLSNYRGGISGSYEDLDVGDTDNLQTLKDRISSLRPYLVMREQDTDSQFEVLEIFPDGRRGRLFAQTLRDLVSMLHAMNVEIEQKVLGLSERVKTDISKSIRELQYQDLRYFRYQLCNPYEEPSIIIRKHVVVLSMNPLRAIFTAERLYLVVPFGASALLSLVQGHMEDMMTESDGTRIQATTVDLFVYQIMFSTILGLHSEELIKANNSVQEILRLLEMNTTVPEDLQEQIRAQKTNVSSQLAKVQAYMKLFQDLSVNENNLAMLNLPLLRRNPALYIKPLSATLLNEVAAFQTVVETYQTDYSSLSTKLTHLIQEIDNAENMMSLKLDTARNQLLITDMTLATVSLTISIANFIIGIFGMNLYSAIEDMTPKLFWSLGVVLIIAVVWGSRQLLMFFNLVDKTSRSLKAFKEHRN